MRVILLDNEPLMLKKLKRMLEGFRCFKVIDVYTSPRKALMRILEEKPDVVFLKIDIAKFSGLEIAEIAKDKLPNIQIIFTSVYSQFAIQAFELDATDYLIKPIGKERLLKTINRVKKHYQKKASVAEVEKRLYAKVCCFGSLNLKWSNKKSYIKVKWRTKKTQELFAYLIHNHGKPLRKDLLVDLIWPHVEWNQGMSLLYTAIYQIRKMLTSIDFNIEIKSSENTYTLLLHDVKVDVHLWEKDIESLKELSAKTLIDYINIIKRYKGNYLESLEYSWSKVEKERLRSLWFHYVKKVTDYLISQKKYIQAIEIYHFAQEVNPLEEESYFLLMQLYHEINEPLAVAAQFEKLKQVLKEELGVEPSSKILTWYNKWKEALLKN